MAAWAAGEALMNRSPTLDRWARTSWTLGVGLALIHVVLAFQLVYDWNHGTAVQATVDQAVDLFGWGWRGGIYVNYIFLAIWVADACSWWLAPMRRASRAAWVETTRRAFFVFMFVNGAIVFAAGISRVVGIACVSLVLAAPLLRRRSNLEHEANSSCSPAIR